jgi:hypothetical protein
VGITFAKGDILLITLHNKGGEKMFIRKKKSTRSLRTELLTILLTTLIGAALIPVSFMASAAYSAVLDDFVIPKPIVNPRTPDEEFFNMRLKFFLPETEPMIKETFGSVLHFEDEAFWEYESYYSRAVSFATNLPTLSKIEYGLTTNYGLSTVQTESYFYQHLIHLTGLEPGKTYHYRIKVKGSDGQFLVSQNYTFQTPVVPPDVIRIPQDLPNQTMPYELNTPNAKYLLTQNIHAPNGAININASNVELDLGGHTIVYDNEFNHHVNEFVNGVLADPVINSDDYGYIRADLLRDPRASGGIKVGVWTMRDIKIFNGTVVQGANGGTGLAGNGYSPIMIDIGWYIEIAGVKVDYYGDSVTGICFDSKSYIHHNVVYDRGTVVDNRQQGIKAITQGIGEPLGPTKYNSVRRARHQGIMISPGGEIYGNEVYGDSFAANGYLLSYESNSRVYSNRIFGLGHHSIGIGNYGMSNAMANNNFIYLSAYAPTRRFFDEDWISSMVGFRGHSYSTEPAPFYNNTFENNVVIVKAWSYNCWARGISVACDPLNRGMIIRNNIVKVETMTNEVDMNTQRYPVTCVGVFGTDEYFDTHDVVFIENRFLTNAIFIAFGDSGGAFNSAFYRNTFEKINHHDHQFWPYRMVTYNADIRNHKIIDSVTGQGVVLRLPPLNLSYYPERWYNLAVGVSSERVYADATTGAPLANKTITWQLGAGGQGSFTTDSQGNAYREWITTWNEHKPGDPARSMPQIHNSTVTFYADGYEPVTKNIADIKGQGPAILFAGSVLPPLYDPNLVVESGIFGRQGLNANMINICFWSRVAYDGVEIYRSQSQNGPFQLASTEYGAAPNGYNDTGLRPNTTYYYKVRLFKGSYFGPMSIVFSAKTSDLVTEGGISGRTWDDTVNIFFWSRSQFDGAEIYRCETQNGPFILIRTEYGVPPGGYNDTGLRPNTIYYYKVRLFQGDYFGPISDAIAVRTY